jgi:NAD(P)-dependent dehydrogenase (short-subunit alcohol dehydrogenase family)
MAKFDLSNKTFVITGGTQGLGEATARAVAASGAAGITICGRNTDRGAMLAKELKKQGTDTLFVKADLENVEDCRRVVREHDAKFGGLDGLANVAASPARGTIDDTTPEAFDAMFALNVRAPFFLTQEAVKIMKRVGRGGSIVNVLSVSAHGGQPFITTYSGSKGALATFTKNHAYALRKDKIRVNGLNIGWMATPNEDLVQRKQGSPANWLARADANAPFGRIIRPEDVATLTCYLFSEDSCMMTGSLVDFDQTIIVGAFD